MPIQQTPSLNLVVDQLRSTPKEARRAVRKAIVDATRDVRADMARRAAWSTRIPGAIRMRVSFASGSVEIRVRSQAAPHARTWEGAGGRREARWPVFGNREVWAGQPTRPFFFPAIRGKRKQLRDAVEKAVIESMPPILR